MCASAAATSQILVTTLTLLRSIPCPLFLERRAHGGGRASEEPVGAVAVIVSTVNVPSGPVALMLSARLVGTGNNGEETDFVQKREGT